MYRRYFIVTLVVATLAGNCLAQGGRRGPGRGQGRRANSRPPINQAITSIPKSNLSGQEQDGLLLMREEEKLAHDVYVELARKWSLRPLQNIPHAEARHINAVKSLLDRYGIEDPVKNKQAGEFSSPRMQSLYDQLITQGRRSAEEAVKVGLLIEELDIADLNQLMTQADSKDIRVIYQNLLKGSRNHLRAFWRQLSQYDAQYSAQHLTQVEFDRIAQSKHERGMFISDPNFQF